jgi:hypothetical protein
VDLNKQIQKELDRFGTEFVTDLRDNLLSKERSNTKSKLSNSIKTLGTFKDGTFTLKISLNDYYTFVDEGRNGEKVQNRKTRDGSGKYGVSKEGQEKIGEWGAARGYIGKFQKEQVVKGQRQVRKKKLSFEKAKKQFIFLVSRKIRMKGYKGNNFYSEVVEDGRFDTLSKQLSDIIGKTIVIEVVK